MTLRKSLVIATVTAIAVAAPALADPHIVYTRHALKVDVRDLDLSRDADRHVLQARIMDSADKVCGGRPDRGNRYSGDELKLLMPAYDSCHADAVRSAQASANVPLIAEIADPRTDRHSRPSRSGDVQPGGEPSGAVRGGPRQDMAFAGESGGVAIRYDDLNLARHAGAEVLVGRLWQAAKQVCGAQHFPSDLHTLAAVQTCAQTSLGRAVADVGEPAVSDVYRQRFGKPLNLAGN